MPSGSVQPLDDRMAKADIRADIGWLAMNTIETRGSALILRPVGHLSGRRPIPWLQQQPAPLA